MEKFGERLRELRTERGLSQVQLEKKLDSKITHSAIAFWEQGQRVPKLDSAILIAKFFGVSLDYLAGLED